MKIEV